jgi:hypothetical protein
MANLLKDFQARRTNYLLNPADKRAALLDNAPVGSVGAPGGLLAAPQQPKPVNALGGLLGASSFVPGIGDFTGPIADAYMYMTEPESRTMPNYAMSALGALPFLPSLATVFHGSPHKFDAFDMSKIGTGEGAQSYGHGLYLAENPEVAQFYSDVLSKGAKAGAYDPWWKDMVRQRMAAGDSFPDAIARVAGKNKSLFEQMSKLRLEDYAPPPPGNLYTVDLPDESIAKMLDWDKPLSEQAPEVRRFFEPMVAPIRAQLSQPAEMAWGDLAAPLEYNPSGHELLGLLRRQTGGAGDILSNGLGPEVSAQLRDQGIPGIRYLDGGSRGAGQGTSNYVVFDDKLPKILKRE